MGIAPASSDPNGRAISFPILQILKKGVFMRCGRSDGPQHLSLSCPVKYLLEFVACTIALPQRCHGKLGCSQTVDRFPVAEKRYGKHLWTCQRRERTSLSLFCLMVLHDREERCASNSKTTCVNVFHLFAHLSLYTEWVPQYNCPMGVSQNHQT